MKYCQLLILIISSKVKKFKKEEIAKEFEEHLSLLSNEIVEKIRDEIK